MSIVKHLFRFKVPLISSTLLLASNITQATPEISSISIDTVDSINQLTINGSGFTEKKFAAPLFWWNADAGETPSSLGRKNAWDGNFAGYSSTHIVAPGSIRSIRWDHGESEGAALAGLVFDSEELYIYRKLYEAFDITKNYAIRTRAKYIAGTLKVGDTVTGRTSGATGVISKLPEVIPLNSSVSTGIYFSPEQGRGSINEEPPVDFIFGEEMVTDSGVKFVNAEGSNTYPTGTFRTFNYKTLRLWHKADKNNSYPVAQGIQGRKYNINHEYTDSTLWNNEMDNPMFQIPNQWQTQEFQYKTSGVGVSDGRFDFIVNGVTAAQKTFVSRDQARPNKYDTLYQSQVSNGALPNSNVYYDSLYVDDTWHRVIICESETWKSCNNREIQIPTSWSDSQITVQLRLSGFSNKESLYVYIINEDGTANEKGFLMCSSCPLPPPLQVN